jgi:AraC-like DNA-binding protein
VPLEDKSVPANYGSRLGRVIFIELSKENLPDERGPGRSIFFQPSFIDKVENFCRKNYGRPIGVATMAKVAKLSRFHFSRLFREARGISPGQYLFGLRLVFAMRLAQTGEYTVKDIAKKCGFTSPNYFCRVFRQTYGITPGSVAMTRPSAVTHPTPRSSGRRDLARRPIGPRHNPN